MEDEGPPPPPPPHGHNPRPPGGGLPDGNYDIFIIPPHSAGGGFIYLPSLQPHRNSFIAGMFVAMAAMGIYVVVMPVLKAWMASILAGNGAGVMMLVAIVGVGAWAIGKTTAESSAGPGANTAGAGAGADRKQQYRSNGPESQNYTPPPPPPRPEPEAAPPPPPPPQSEPEPPPKPKPSAAQSGWEKAREETKRKEEERKRTEELKKRREAAQKIREEKEAAAKKAREEAEAAERKAREEREAAEREREAAEKKAREEKEAADKAAKEAAERNAKAQAEKAKWEQARAQQKAQRDREAAEKKLKEEREKAAQEKEAKEREAKAAADAAKAAADKEAALKASKERIAKLMAERKSASRTASASGSPNTSPTKKYAPPTSKSAIGTEDEYSYRPYDKPASRARSAFQSSASSVSGLSESSYAPSMSTARTTPPPSQRGPYSTNDPNKIQIRAVYLFSDSFPNKPVSQLVAGEGSVTDGLILKIETEALFIDDDVRKVGQREWDVKAWTISTMETGVSKAKGLHVFRATTKDSENKKYTFVLEAKEAHKVTQGVHRLKDGSLARSIKVKEIKEGDMNKLLTSLGW